MEEVKLDLTVRMGSKDIVWNKNELTSIRYTLCLKHTRHNKRAISDSVWLIKTF